MTHRWIASITAAGMLASAAAPALADEAGCKQALQRADKALADARVDGFGESAAWSEAATLVSGAKVQKTFGEFDKCVAKADKARAVLKQAK